MASPLPHDAPAERSVLAAVLLENSAWVEIEGVVTAADFHDAAHSHMFAAMAALFARSEPVDPVTLGAELRSRGRLEGVGGQGAISDLTDEIPTTAHVARHAALIAELAIARRVILDAHRLIAEAQSGARGEKLADSAAKLAMVASSRSSEKGPTHVSAMVEGAFARIEARMDGASMPGVVTGFEAIDAVLNPMRAGQLIVVGGRPSSGKTSMVTRWCVNAALANKSVLFFSLETKEEDLGDRLLCMNASVNVAKMQKGTVDQREFDRLTRAGASLFRLPLHFDDGYELSGATLRRKARAHKLKHGLDLIVIDFLQLMLSDRDDSASREREVARISRGLKALAKELGVPIVALAQLNRGPEGRTVKDHRPKISDLRDSGSIEQDADVVAFMYRDAMYDPHADQLSAEFIIAKQKNGPTDTALVRFVRESTRFEDIGEQRSETPYDHNWSEADRDAAE